MPREHINNPRVELWIPITGTPEGPTGWDVRPVPFNAPGEDPPGSHVEVTPTLQIHWTASSREGAEGTPDAGFAQVEMSVHIETLRRMLAEVEMTAKHGPDHVPAQLGFFTIALTRQEMQKLIRVTRRARDQVFEGDE